MTCRWPALPDTCPDCGAQILRARLLPVLDGRPFGDITDLRIEAHADRLNENSVGSVLCESAVGRRVRRDIDGTLHGRLVTMIRSQALVDFARRMGWDHAHRPHACATVPGWMRAEHAYPPAVHVTAPQTLAAARTRGPAAAGPEQP